MSALGWLFLGLLALLVVILAIACWRQDVEIQRLKARHLRPRERGGEVVALPAPLDPPEVDWGTPEPEPVRTAPSLIAAVPTFTPSELLSTGELAALDAKVDKYLPPPPVPADRPVTRTPTRDRAPWTGEQPALSEAELDEMSRVSWIRSQLPENEADVTREDMERVLASLRALPDAPAYGQVPVTDVLAAEAGGLLT